jgi:ABC-type Fe3+ transport system substrate-binding protein
MFGGGTDPFLELERSDLLEPVEISSGVLKAIPRDVSGVPLYSPSKRWFAAALSTFGILYNKVAIQKLRLPVPSTWKDLTAPPYFDLIGAGDPRKSGSMHAMYEIVLQGYGWEKGWEVLQRIAGNVRNFSGGGTNVGKEIASGEIVYGLAIDTYAGELIRRIGDERLGYVVPKDYAAVNGDGIAVLRGAPNKALATAFVEFVLSDEGQRLWYTRRGLPGGPVEFELGKLPILPALYGTVETTSVVKENPFEWKSILPYDADTAGKRWGIVNDLFGVYIIDVHDRLVQTLDPKHRGAGTLPVFPVSQADVSRLIPSWSANTALRSSTLKEWSDTARASLPLERSALSYARWLPPLLFLFFLLRGGVSRLRPRARASQLRM